MNSIQVAITAEIFAALEANTLELPTLPDLAIKIRNAVDDPNVSASQFVNLLSAEPVISMHIIKSANSAALSNGQPVHNLQSAISRIGYQMLRSIVLSMTMTHLFQARSPLINMQMKRLWQHSREVAAVSYVLAQQQKHLRPDQAMLAGLIHDIGALPLYRYAERYHEQLDKEMLDELVVKFSAPIGTRLLKSWGFPEDMINIIDEREDLQRMRHSGLSDYADVVIVANLQIQGKDKLVDWENIAAAAKLGYTPDECQNFMTHYADQLAQIQDVLGINAVEVSKKNQPAPIQNTPQPELIQAPQQIQSKQGFFARLFNSFK